MDEKLVPASVRWMMPIAEELLEQHSRNADIALSDESEAAIDQQLSHEVRQDIEDWLDSDTGTYEAGRILMLMILLDELGYLEKTDPILDYACWRGDLTSRNWGRFAAQQR